MSEDIGYSKEYGRSSSEGLELRLNDDNGSYTVIGIGSCTDTNIIIDMHGGLPISSVAEEAFADCENITSVTLGDSVRAIYKRAFARCKGLKCVSIGRGLERVEVSAFYDCKGISSVYIYDLASWCNIEFADVYANPFYFAEKWFLNDAIITDLVIPSEIREIKDSAFVKFKALKSIIIHGDVNSIGEYAFSGCSELETIDIPEGVKKIGEYAFSGCKKLKNVTIPKSLERLGNYAFYDCDSLVYYETDTALYLGNDNNPFIVLAGIKDKNAREFNINKETKFICEKAFMHCESLKKVEIPSGIISIGENAFCGSKSLKSVSIPKGVTTIGRFAFKDCESLTSIEIPDSVTTLGERAFSNCSSLASVIIGDGLKIIAVGMLEKCVSLKSIRIGRGVTYISSAMFRDATNLKKVFFADTTDWWFSKDRSSPILPSQGEHNVKNASANAKDISKYKDAHYFKNFWSCLNW